MALAGRAVGRVDSPFVQTTRRAVRAAALGLVLTAASVLLPVVPPAGAAGEITHTWMAASAVERVDIPALRGLLETHPDQVRAGALFPDGGYYLADGRTWGEEAHWGRFTDAYLDRIRTRGDCGDLTDPDGPCAAEIAHLMGVRAHGTGDEVWDWLFEPYSPDLDEYYLPEELLPFSDGSGQELPMDFVAIGVHHRPTGPMPPAPSVPDLIAAFAAAGVEGVTPEMLADARATQNNVMGAEAAWTPEHLPGVLREMPWMANNIVGAPGGVDYAATAIAAQWEHMWRQLLGEDAPTEVAVTYPFDRQRRVPPTGWERSFQPGSSPGRGGARTRISATLTYAVPYSPTNGGPPVPAELPAGSMTLTEAATGDPVPLMAGYPRSVPYGPDAGEYTVDVQPAADLEACTWYRVRTTEALLDAGGEPVVPASWRFRTGADDPSRRCPGDPPTARELHVRAHCADRPGRVHRRSRVPGRHQDSADAYVARLHRLFAGRDPDPGGRGFR